MKRFSLAFALLFIAAAATAGDPITVPARAPRVAAPDGGLPQLQPIFVPNAACSEAEPNEQTGNASPMTLPANCNGFASSTDASSIRIDYGGGLLDGLEDIYTFSLASSARVTVNLAWNDTGADLDVFLFQPSGSSINILDGSATNGSAPEGFTTATLAPGTYYLGVTAFSGGSSYTLTAAQASASSACSQNTTTVCLNNGRFRVRATWNTGSQNGNGGAVRLTSDTGYFWFFGNANVEMVVKILDACSFNNRFWVFAGGLTDVGVSLNVTDTQTGVTKTYTNSRDTPFAPIQDTDAFATCGSTPSCTYALAPSSQSFGSGGGSGSVGMTAANGCNWSATSDSNWITITGGASGSGNGTINFSVAANSGGARSGTISAGGQSATISQSGATPTCTYLVTPTSASYGSSGGSGSVTVTAPAGCAWTAGSNVSFVTITSGSSGSGNGTVNYNVAANSGSSRSGSMTIAGQTVTISQSGAPAANYNGTWNGTTSQGKTLTFNIANNALTSFTLNWATTGGSCSATGTTTVTFTTPLPITNPFSFSIGGSPTINVSGSFLSTSSVSGNFSVSNPPGCPSSGSGTFSATKN